MYSIYSQKGLPGSNWCFSFAPELVGYSAPRDLHRRAAYSICESLFLILTHLAYIANGKIRVILCNNFTGRISVTLLCGICDVSYPTKQR